MQKRILIAGLILFATLFEMCSNGNNKIPNRTTDTHTLDTTNVAKYLPAVGDSSIYTGARRDREMKIEKKDLDASKVDTTYLDTIYLDTVVIKRTSSQSVMICIRDHDFLENLPDSDFHKVYQMYDIDNLKFMQNTSYSSMDVDNIIYDDSLKELENRVSNILGHYETHKTFKGKKLTMVKKK